MKSTKHNRYIKGIFALGLALALSNSYLSTPERESQRQEERVLSFNAEESSYRKIAMTSSQKINAHIDNAIYLANSSDNELIKHVKASKEIIRALRMLMPHMEIVSMLNEMQQEINYKDQDKMQYDLLRINRKFEEIQPYIPKLAEDLRSGLKNIEFLIKKNKEPTLIAKKIKLLATTLSENSSYIPVSYLENNLTKIENMINDESSQTHRILPTLEKIKQCLLACENNETVLMRT